MSDAFGTNWLDLSSTSNRYIQTYYKGFVDISGGPLYVRNNNLYVRGGDISLNGRLYSAGDASFGNRVFITGNLSVSGNITGTYPNSSIPSSAIIGGVGSAGSSNFTTDVSINQRLIVLGDTSLNSRLYVGSDVSFGGRLFTSGDVTFNGKLNVGYSTISTSSSTNISVGAGAVCGSGNYNTTLGWNAGGIVNFSTNTGNNNVALGDYTISTITSGYFNTAVGNDSLKFITTGYYNTAVGHSTLYNTSTGYNNTAIGYRAGYSASTFNNSTAIGYNSAITANNQITLGTSTEYVYCPGGLSVVGTVTLPSASISDSALSSNIVTLTGTQTLTNKTLTTPVIGSISNSGTITIPTGTLTLATLTGTETLTNKTITTSGLLTAGAGLSVTGTVTLPAASIADSAHSSNIVTLSGTQTLTNKTITTSGLLTALADVSMNSRLYVGSDASFGGNLAIQISKGIYGGSTTAVPSDLNVYGLNVGSGSFVSNSDCSFNGNVSIGGNINISKSGTHYITGTLNTTTSVVTTSTVNGNETVGGTETITGLLTASGGLVVNGTSTINGNLALSTSKGISGGSLSAVAADFNVYGLNIGAGSFVAASDCSLNGNLSLSTTKALYGGSTTVGTSKLSVYGLNVGAGNIDTNIITGGPTIKSTASSGVTITNNSNDVTALTVTGNSNSATYIPLVVTGFNGVINYGGTGNNYSAYQKTGATSNVTTSLTGVNISLKTQQGIWSELTGLFVTSDERIKTNIKDIESNYAIDTIRKIKPKSYNKIDTPYKILPEYGFVAQEVQELLPQSIGYQKNYIPNVFGLASVTENNKLVLIEKTTKDLSGQEIKLKLIDYYNQDIFVTLDKIIDDQNFTIKESLSEKDLSDNKIFVYGQEVDDFRILDKETIFTVGIGAIKKLDEDLTAANKKIADLQSQIDILVQRLNNANI